MNMENIATQLAGLHAKYDRIEVKTDKILRALVNTSITAVIFAVAVVAVLVVGIWIG